MPNPAGENIVFKSADETAPAVDAIAVAPNDGTDLPNGTCQALYIGGTGSGNLTIITAMGNSATFTGLSAGALLPVRAKRVMATGTDVTNILALY